jgi:glycosyltransferase involved in cell wall biosynthesis
MSDREPIGSVLIPAHDEEAVIGRCLDRLFDGVDPARLEVAVVCNGCHDGTAEAARATGHPVQVIELDEASKPAALRAGDRALHAFPRLYLDADVVLRGAGALEVLDHLSRPGAVAARPPIRFDTSHSSAVVRRYFRARAQIPSVMGSLWGAGVYGLTEDGRARFGEHPDVVAEDHWVDQHFPAADIAIVGDEPVVVVAPARLRDLLKVRRRAYRGVVENRAAGEGDRLAKETTASTRHDVLALCRSVPGVVDAAAYVFVAAAARVYTRFGRSTRWERDESSRSVAVG